MFTTFVFFVASEMAVFRLLLHFLPSRFQLVLLCAQLLWRGLLQASVRALSMSGQLELWNSS